jgi:hypothetical protein
MNTWKKVGEELDSELEAEVKNWKETIKKYEDAYNALIVKNNRLQAELDNLALASHSDKRFSGYETIHINKDEIIRNDELRDQFACVILQGFYVNPPMVKGFSEMQVAEAVYKQADAMLKAREKK